MSQKLVCNCVKWGDKTCSYIKCWKKLSNHISITFIWLFIKVVARIPHRAGRVLVTITIRKPLPCCIECSVKNRMMVPSASKRSRQSISNSLVMHGKGVNTLSNGPKRSVWDREELILRKIKRWRFTSSFSTIKTREMHSKVIQVFQIS